MDCQACSEEIPEDSIFCPECGARQDLSKGGGRSFGVVTPQAVQSGNTDEEGAYYEDQKLIVLDKGLIEIGDRYSCILAWHEIQHAIFNQYSLVDANEEKIIHAFSQGVVQVLGDNPKFLQWMLGCLKL